MKLSPFVFAAFTLLGVGGGCKNEPDTSALTARKQRELKMMNTMERLAIWRSARLANDLFNKKNSDPDKVFFTETRDSKSRTQLSVDCFVVTKGLFESEKNRVFTYSTGSIDGKINVSYADGRDTTRNVEYILSKIERDSIYRSFFPLKVQKKKTPQPTP
ncbi:MAG: hypothetical protein QE263_06530 [Vampirovibrionales bacterium]|nr:hypothetical protein [Vampirovibrionales bacterium]